MLEVLCFLAFCPNSFLAGSVYMPHVHARYALYVCLTCMPDAVATRLRTVT